jgi:RHS repeat-associated protein
MATSANAFIQVVGAGVGSGPGNVTLHVDNNTDTAPKIGSVRIGNRTLVVVQGTAANGTCAYSVAPPELDFQASGGNAELLVSTNFPDCPWRVDAALEDAWAQTDPTSGVATGEVTVLVGPNPDVVSRTAYLYIGGFEVPVEQSPEMCDLAVTPTGLSYTADAGTQSITITAPSGCGWEVVSLDDFVHVTANPTGSGPGTANIYVENNPQPTSRSGTVRVSHGSLIRYVTIGQAGVGGEPPPPPTGPEEVVYFHTDAIGSVRLITDAAGAVVARYDFQPFGQEQLADGPAAAGNALRFAGKEHDPETGATGWTPLDYFGARSLQGRAGRFVTVDPILDVDAAQFTPQRWNRYAYALNNPLFFIDPNGRQTVQAEVDGYGELQQYVLLSLLRDLFSVPASRPMVASEPTNTAIVQISRDIRRRAEAVTDPRFAAAWYAASAGAGVGMVSAGPVAAHAVQQVATTAPAALLAGLNSFVATGAAAPYAKAGMNIAVARAQTVYAFVRNPISAMRANPLETSDFLNAFLSPEGPPGPAETRWGHVFSAFNLIINRLDGRNR